MRPTLRATLHNVAGYSGTPLPVKLGIRDGRRVAFVNEPAAFAEALGPLPPSVTVASRASGPLDVVVAFFTRRAELARRVDALGRAVAPDGGLWVAWPKKASGVATDITEDVVREVALPRGLVDNKVCAIDGTWSGLRLVWRKELRVPTSPASSSPLLRTGRALGRSRAHK